MKRRIVQMLICVNLLAINICYAQITAHPRFITPAKLAYLKTLTVPTNPRWAALKKAADAGIATPNGGNAVNLAYAYLFTGNAAYGNAAITAAMAQATQPVGATNVSGDSWYYMRSNYMLVVRVFDCCYPLLTPQQKTTIATWLMDTSIACNGRTSGWSIANWEDNYRYGFDYGGMAGLTCFGDEPRAQAEIDRWKKNFDTQIVPVMQDHGRGGQWLESTSYGLYNSNMLGVQIDAYQNALGVDIVTNQPTAQFLRDVCLYTLESTDPTLAYRWPFGDQSRSSMPSIMEYDRDAVLPAAALVGGQVQSEIKQWLALVKQPNMAQRAWSEFLYYPEAATVKDYRTVEPTSYYIPGTGTQFYRQDWSKTATMWSAWSGPLNQSHEFPEANGMQIFKGGWLVPMAPIYSKSGIVGSFSGGNPDTLPFNAVTVSGHPQGNLALLPPDKGGHVISHEVGADYVVFEGQAAQAYSWRDASRKVYKSAVDAVRKVIYVPSTDVFLVVDRITKVNPSDTIEVHWHSVKSPSTTVDTFSWDNGAYKLAGQAFGGTVSSAPDNYGANGATSSYRTDITSAGGNPTDTISTALQITPLASSAATVIALDCPTHTGISIGKWILLTGKSENVQGDVIFTIPNPTAPSEAVVADLIPSTSYGQWGTTSASGVLRFTIPAGIGSVTLNWMGQPPPPPPPVAVLTSIVLNPSSANIMAGASIQITASGFDQNGADFALAPGSVIWQSNGGQVSPTGSFVSTLAGNFTVSATSGGISGTASISVTAPVTLKSISVIGPSQVQAGQTAQYMASGTGSDGLPFALGAITWTTTTGTISSSGTFTAAGVAGISVVTATFQGIAGIANVNVTAPPPMGVQPAGKFIDASNPLSKGLVTFFAFNEGAAAFYDLVSGKAAISGTQPYSWVSESTAYAGKAVRFTGASPPYIPIPAAMLVKPLIGYTVAALFKMDAAAPVPSAVPHYIGDTGPGKSTAGFALYPGFPNGNQITFTPRNAANNSVVTSIPCNSTGWVLVVFTVTPTTYTIYANLDANGNAATTMRQMVQIPCSLTNTWFRSVPPQQLVVTGTISSGGSNSTVLGGNMGMFAVWYERVLTLTDANSLLKSPWGVVK